MGFLDRLAGDLIAGKSGGSNRTVRRMVRRAGGGKLLLMGAAAMAFEAFDDRQKASAGPQPPPGGGLPPIPVPPSAPLPPIPGTEGAVPPPTTLPALPTDSGAASEEGSFDVDAELPASMLFPVVRAMVAAALADGRLDATEKAAIEKSLDQSDLTYDQVQQVHRDMLISPSVDELAELVRSDEVAEVVFRFAVLVTRADGEVTDEESSWLVRLGERLGLTEADRGRLEAEVLGA